MGRRDDQPAVAEMGPHQAVEPLLGCRVERGGGLVEEPQRPRDRDHAGKRQPAPLAGREVAGRNIGEVAEADSIEAAFRRFPLAGGGLGVEEAHPEGEVFHHRKGPFEGVEMAEIVGLLADAELVSHRPRGVRRRGPDGSARQ